MSNKKKMAAGIAAAVVALALAVVLIFTMNNRPLTAADMLSLGERYLLEMQFEQALVQFLAVIEIEPNNVRAYLGAAEAFVGLGQMENAANILRQGLEQTGSEQIRQRLTELEGTAEAQRQVEGNDSELVTDINAEQAEPDENNEDIISDVTEVVNLTGMPIMSFQEFADWGFPHGVRLQDIIGRYGLDQSHIEMIQDGINNHPEYPVWSASITLENGAIAPPEGFYAIYVDRELFIDTVWVSDGSWIIEPTCATQILRFSLGMSLLEVVESLALYNSQILAVAQNPYRNNFLVHGAIEDGNSLVIRDSARGEDGTAQNLFLGFNNDENSPLVTWLNIILHYENRSSAVYLAFNSNGLLMSITVSPNL